MDLTTKTEQSTSTECMKTNRSSRDRSWEHDNSIGKVHRSSMSKRICRQSPSPTRSKDSEAERMMDLKDRDRDRVSDKQRRKSKSGSPDNKVQKRSSKEREREYREKEREGRDHEKEKRECEKEKVEELGEEERQLEKELDKIRKTRFPTDWIDYRQWQFDISHINYVWDSFLAKSGGQNRSRSTSGSPHRTPDIPNPTPLSRSLTYHSKDINIVEIYAREGRHVKLDYPVHLVRKTKSRPHITYGVNPFSYEGFYKSRALVFGEEVPEIIETMKDIINMPPPKGSPSLNTTIAAKSREWFASSGQQFCPSEGSKGVLIAHLYSEDDLSRENSPLLKKSGTVHAEEQNHAKIIPPEKEPELSAPILISFSEKETHTLLSEFDDDPFLQSVLNDDLSVEALLEKVLNNRCNIGPGPMTPTGEPPTDTLVVQESTPSDKVVAEVQESSPSDKVVAVAKESPPVQLNVADSTISDSELANVTSYKASPETPDSGKVSSDGFASLNTNYSELPCLSPPRRLSLDERLELEMGIKLRDDTHVPYPIHHGQQFGPQGKFPPLPSSQQPGSMGVMDHSFPGWIGPGHGFQKPPPGHFIKDSGPPFGGHFPPNGILRHAQPQRTQSHIVQVGNVIQVVPAEFSPTPITITSNTKARIYDGRPHLQIGGSKQEMEEGVRNRVVTIKVPVIPFSIPMIQPEDMPAQSDEAPIRRRSKHRNMKRRRSGHSSAAPQEHVLKEENALAAGPQTEKMEMDESGEIISEEEIALLKEAMTSTPGELDNIVSENPPPQGSPDKSDSEAGSDLLCSSVPYCDDMDEADESEPNDMSLPEAPLTLRPPLRKIEILPAPKEGILVAVGFRERTVISRKSVKFADGVNPGYGTSPSDGEDMASSPPPSTNLYKKQTRDRSLAKKRKIKKSVRKSVEDQILDGSESPPPCPCGPYPFCPPGILYQVCPQYAVLYAQAVAEKGFDIVFQPSTQLPYMPGGEETFDKSPNNMIQEKCPELQYIGQTDCHNSPFIPTPNDPSGFTPYSNYDYPPQEPPGSRIPTIMNLQVMTAPHSSVYPVNSLQEQVNAMYTSPEESNNVPFQREDDLEIPLPPRASELDEIPLPSENPNNIYISPTKIPIPQGTPPERVSHSHHHHASHSNSYDRENTKSKPKKTKKERRLARGQPNEPNSISIPLSKIISNNTFNHNNGPGEYAPINHYDFTPFNINMGMSRPVPVGLPPGIDIHAPPPPIKIRPPARIAHVTPNAALPISDTVSSGFGKFSHSNGAVIGVIPSHCVNITTVAKNEDLEGDATPPPPGTTP